MSLIIQDIKKVIMNYILEVYLNLNCYEDPHCVRAFYQEMIEQKSMIKSYYDMDDYGLYRVIQSINFKLDL